MGAAVIGIVEQIHIPRLQDVPLGRDQALDTLAHRPQVDGDMGSIGHELSLLVEDGAGEVEALLDIDRGAGVLQGNAHLLGNGTEEVVEDLQ